MQSISVSYKNEWDNLVTHPLQSWAWGTFREKMGLSIERLGQIENNTLINPYLLTRHPIMFTGKELGYVPKSSIPTSLLLEYLAKDKKLVSVQFEPDGNETTFLQTENRVLAQLKEAARPLFTNYTFILDITKTEEELLKAMHAKTRYNIKIAQKHQVTIQEDNSSKAFETYIKLTNQTTARQGFYAHSPKYQTTMWETMHTAKIARLFTATYNGEILATWIFFIWKDRAYYPYGASSREHKEVMAPTLLLWEIIRMLKKEGIKSIDLWGAIGPQASPNDPWYGFHRFKEGFHPDLVKTAGSYDFIIHPFYYSSITYANSIRWYFLHMKKKIFH